MGRTCRLLPLCLALIGSAGARAQTPAVPEVPADVLIAASITGADKGTARPGDKLGLSIDLTEPPSGGAVSPPADEGSRTLPRAALLRSDGSLKQLEVVVWLDPRYFSLGSDRHGLLVPGQRAVRFFQPDDTDDDVRARNLRLRLRRQAPENETLTVGILLLGDGELLTDLALPLVVTKDPAISRAVATSPFRPRSTLGIPSDDGVLTLIELHEKQVQLTFSCAAGMRSWRVASKRLLKDWPEYVKEGIAEAELATVASTFSDVLFPTGGRCETSTESCAAAATLFNDWARRAGDAATRHTLTVQTLPLEDDALFTPVLMPVGFLPIFDEAGDLADPAPPPAPMDGGTSDPMSGIDDPLGELTVDGERAADPAIPSDPADPAFEVNRPLTTVTDPVASRDLSDLPLADIGGQERRTEYLAYKIATHLPLYRFNTQAVRGACIDTWSILAPPDVKDPEGGLDAARDNMRGLLDLWERLKTRPSPQPFEFERSLSPLESNERRPEKLTGAWMIVSHYDKGVLRMPRKDGTPQTVGEAQIKRKLAPPGVVVLLACQTAVPAADTFLQHLIDNGASTLILTSALLPGPAAGQFATALMDVLGEAGPDGLPVEDAFWEALRRLPAQYAVPRFVLAGDPSVRLCLPPLMR